MWTSGAQDCNRGLATIRTDPVAPKHQGITVMVIDLSAPGIEIRPLRQITGDARFNEVFFDDVFVPDSDVVGAVNQGWAVARATLGNERVSIGALPRQLSAVSLAQSHARYAAGDAGLAREVGRLIAEEIAADLINLRQVERAVSGAGPSPEGNLTKLLAAEQRQSVSELGLAIASVAAVSGDEQELASLYLSSRASTIAGGTSEVSRNVIAERILGLPREPAMK